MKPENMTDFEWSHTPSGMLELARAENRNLTARLAAAEADVQAWKDQCGELAAKLSVLRLKYEEGC